ncbi:MAG: diguanylate cyclase [Gemmatimonadales bacterium]
MRNRPSILFHSPGDAPVPALLTEWGVAHGYAVVAVPLADEVETILLRGTLAYVLIDGAGGPPALENLIGRLKGDPYTAITPVAVLATRHDTPEIAAWFRAGADEVLTPLLDPIEHRSRLDAMVVRAERDLAVHPSTRLPGTTEIERAIRRSLNTGGEFAVCYADLDHFKEFNDRYSYYDGDRIILILSRILHDVVKGIAGSPGFVGHIGGDDFIFIVPNTITTAVCTEMLSVFDTLIPLQYNDQDRRAGYFFGKDRRGQLHRVPLMTLSIGIVTNRNRSFTHPAQLSELATEMKSYAKTLPGSVFVVDRRYSTDVPELDPAPKSLSTEGR